MFFFNSSFSDHQGLVPIVDRTLTFLADVSLGFFSPPGEFCDDTLIRLLPLHVKTEYVIGPGFDSRHCQIL
jgi:hypothetical protein